MDATGRFYREHKDRLYAYLLRLTGERQVALDLVQESFTRYLGRYGSREANRCLLYAIARNAALDWLRKPKPLDLEAIDPQDPAIDPEGQTIQRQAVHRMRAAVGRLAPPDRELIALVADAEMSYREIGNLLGMREATVKVRVHRIRLKLREWLASGEK